MYLKMIDNGYFGLTRFFVKFRDNIWLDYIELIAWDSVHETIIFLGSLCLFLHLYVIDIQLYMSIRHLVGIPKISFLEIEYKPPFIHLYASLTGKRAQCPVCQKYSHSVHDRYQRHLTDLPAFQYNTVILLTIRKFKCLNEHCKRKVFTERYSHITPYASRTENVWSGLTNVSRSLSGGAP